MDSKKETLLIMVLTFCYKYGYQFDIDINDKYNDDDEIIDCKLTLYLLLLTEKGKEQNKLFKDFEEKYSKLSKEKQEYIKNDLKKIFKEQDKNCKEKEKKLWEKQ